MKFPSSEVAFYVDKSKLPSRLAKNIIAISEPIHPAEIQERIDRVVGPTFVDSYFLHLAACCFCIQPNSFLEVLPSYMNWLSWFNFLILMESTLVILIIVWFFVINSLSYKGVYINSFFPQIAGLRSSLLTECLPLTKNLFVQKLLSQRFKTFCKYRDLTYHLKLYGCAQERTKVRKRMYKLRTLRTRTTWLDRTNLEKIK